MGKETTMALLRKDGCWNCQYIGGLNNWNKGEGNLMCQLDVDEDANFNEIEKYFKTFSWPKRFKCEFFKEGKHSMAIKDFMHNVEKHENNKKNNNYNNLANDLEKSKLF